MTVEERQKMDKLCAEIKQEKNYQRFEELSRELHALVATKEQRFPEHQQHTEPSDTAWKLISGSAKQIIKPLHSTDREKVEVHFRDAEPLYSEIRIENSFTDASGALLAIQKGADIQVKFEAPKDSFRHNS